MKMERVIIVGMIVFLIALTMTSSASAIWWDGSWSNKREVKIYNSAGSALSDYQVYVDLSSTPINETSLRVVNETADAVVSHWCESVTGGNCYGVWFNVTSISASSWLNDTYYIYYTNPSASSASNGTSTFEFFDDFEDGTCVDEVVSNFGNWKCNRASYIVGNYAYVTETNGLHVVNISDINNPSVIGYVALGTQTLDIEMEGNYAYVSVLSSSKLSVVNISNKTNPVEVGSVTDATKLNQIHGINKSGDYIYCCAYASGGANGHFTIVNVSDPTNPTIEGWVANDGNNYIKGSHDVRVIGDYAYLAASNHNVDNDGRVTIINVSDKSNPSVVSSLTGSELSRIADIQVKGNYAFVGQFGYPSGAPANRYFRVINISNVSNPFLAGNLSGYNMYVGYIYGDLIFCADNRHDYVNVIDISTPTSPSFVKQYTIPGSFAVLHVFLTADGNHAIVARYNDDANNKFYVIETSGDAWTIAESETGDTVSATTKKLVMEKGGTVGYFSLIHNTTSQYSSKRFWDFLVEYPPTKRCNLVLNGDNANPSVGGIYLAFDASGVRYYDTGYHTICSMDNNTEYKISIVPNVTVDTFDIYVYKDGVEVSYSGAHTGLGFRNDATYLNQWRPVIYSSNIEKGTYDNFLVRKYASPEPTSQLGDEEFFSSFIPANSTNLQNNTGNYWVNYTWDAGTLGNITNSYNVSWNLTWYNNTLVTYMNDSVGASGWANITVYAYNSSGSGTLSIGSISDQVQAPAAAGGGTTPLISSVADGFINSTAQWVSWAVNQSCSNRVKYSLYADMSGEWWGAWENATATPNITLAGLGVAKYHYQAWSYNTSADTLTNNSTTANFTTDATAPVIADMARSPSQVLVGDAVTVSCTVTDAGSGVKNVTVQIKNAKDQVVNYSMVAGAGDSYSYEFSYTGAIGVYHIQNFYAYDQAGNFQTEAFSLTFSAIEYGGGGGAAPPGVPTPTPEVNVTATPPPPPFEWIEQPTIPVSGRDAIIALAWVLGSVVVMLVVAILWNANRRQKREAEK